MLTLHFYHLLSVFMGKYNAYLGAKDELCFWADSHDFGGLPYRPDRPHMWSTHGTWFIHTCIHTCMYSPSFFHIRLDEHPFFMGFIWSKAMFLKRSFCMQPFGLNPESWRKNPVDFLRDSLDGQDGPCLPGLWIWQLIWQLMCLPCYKLGLHRLHSLTLPLTCFLNFKNDRIL